MRAAPPTPPPDTRHPTSPPHPLLSHPPLHPHHIPSSPTIHAPPSTPSHIPYFSSPPTPPSTPSPRCSFLFCPQTRKRETRALRPEPVAPRDSQSLELQPGDAQRHAPAEEVHPNQRGEMAASGDGVPRTARRAGGALGRSASARGCRMEGDRYAHISMWPRMASRPRPHALASQRMQVHTGEPHDRSCPVDALMRSADLAHPEAHLGLGDAAASEHRIGLPAHIGADAGLSAPLRSWGGQVSGERALGESASSPLSMPHIKMTRQHI